MNLINMNLIYLHIPHTAGRSIRRILFNTGFFKEDADPKVHFVHNPTDMAKLPSELTSTNPIKYFVLRPTVDRIVGQYAHYSRNLKTVGQVNHLILNDLLAEYPDFDPDDPYQFINLSSNRNIYCKFLLGRVDLDEQLVDKDFEEIKEMFKGPNKPIWDTYSMPIQIPNLEKVLNIVIVPPAFRQTAISTIDKYLNNDKLIEEIKKLNRYDIMLYEFLN